METLKKINAEEALQGKPRPHYLVGEVEVSEDLNTLCGTAVFPSSDISVGDRGHVNVAHKEFAIWSGAHILADLNGLENTRVTDILPGRIRGGEFRPDVPARMELQISDRRGSERIARGVIRATFVQGEVISEFGYEWIASKK